MIKSKIKIIFLGAFLTSNFIFAAPGPIDFGAADIVKRLKTSFDNSVDLLFSTSAADHGNKFFTARTMLRLLPGNMSAYDQKSIRNEICVSSRLYAVAATRDIGSLAVYKRGQTVVSIADNGLSGRPLESVLRELSDRPAAEKDFFARYYAANMAKILGALDGSNIIWNTIDTRKFYVRPDGTLTAFDFSEAYSDAATRVADKQAQLNTFMTETLQKVYHLLFPDPVEAAAQYEALVTQARGTDGQVAVDADAARNFAWTLGDIKAVIANSFGANAYNATAAVPFSGGIDAGLGGNNAGAVAGQFDANIANFLTRENHKPYRQYAEANVAPADHQAAVAGNRGVNGFGIADDVRQLLINPLTNAAYADLNTMCNTWNGR